MNVLKKLILSFSILTVCGTFLFAKGRESTPSQDLLSPTAGLQIGKRVKQETNAPEARDPQRDLAAVKPPIYEPSSSSTDNASTRRKK
jgi:hypothetical protein